MPHGAFHGCVRAYLRSSPRHDRPFKDQEELITANDNYQQVAHENCRGVIMKVIVMKLESSQLRCKHIHTYSKDKCETLSLIRCLENLQGLVKHRITPFTAYCEITVYLFRVSVMY